MIKKSVLIAFKCNTCMCCKCCSCIKFNNIVKLWDLNTSTLKNTELDKSTLKHFKSPKGRVFTGGGSTKP